MKIKIYAIGHLKEPYLKQGINEYLERLKPYVQVEIIEVNDESVAQNPSQKEIEIAKDKEGQRILKLLKNDEYVIGLDLAWVLLLINGYKLSACWDYVMRWPDFLCLQLAFMVFLQQAISVSERFSRSIQ